MQLFPIHRRNFQAVGAIFAAFVLANCAPSGQVYSDDAGRYRALFPGPAAVQIETIDTDFGSVEKTLRIHRTPTEFYVVSYGDLPDELVQTVSPERRRENGKQQLLKIYGATLDSEQSVPLKGSELSGHEYSLIAHDQSRIRARLYEVEGRLYILSGRTPNDPAARARVESFLESFEYRRPSS